MFQIIYTEEGNTCIYWIRGCATAGSKVVATKEFLSLLGIEIRVSSK
jgi:hypothetical protein